MRFPGQSVAQVKSQASLPEFSLLSDEGFPMCARRPIRSKTSLAFSKIPLGAEQDAEPRTMQNEYLSYEGHRMRARKPCAPDNESKKIDHRKSFSIDRNGLDLSSKYLSDIKVFEVYFICVQQNYCLTPNVGHGLRSRAAATSSYHQRHHVGELLPTRARLHARRRGQLEVG
jgi:hypothetical protein